MSMAMILFFFVTMELFFAKSFNFLCRRETLQGKMYTLVRGKEKFVLINFNV